MTDRETLTVEELDALNAAYDAMIVDGAGEPYHRSLLPKLIAAARKGLSAQDLTPGTCPYCKAEAKHWLDCPTLRQAALPTEKESNPIEGTSQTRNSGEIVEAPPSSCEEVETMIERLKTIAIRRAEDYSKAGVICCGQDLVEWEASDLLSKMREDLAGRDRTCDGYAEENQRFFDEIERLRACCGWQPIETAPKDGTLIVVGWAGREFFYLARWQERNYISYRGPKKAWWGAGGSREPVYVYDGSTGGINLDPTHWMLLPKSPQQKSPLGQERGSEKAVPVYDLDEPEPFSFF